MRLGGWAAGLCGSRAGTRRTHPPRRSPHTPQPRADAPNQKAYLRTPVSTPVTVRLLLLSKRRIGHMIHEPLSHVAHESISVARPRGRGGNAMRRGSGLSCDPRARWARWRGSRETPLISRAATVHSVADLSRRLATVQSPRVRTTRAGDPDRGRINRAYPAAKFSWFARLWASAVRASRTGNALSCEREGVVRTTRGSAASMLSDRAIEPRASGGGRATDRSDTGRDTRPERSYKQDPGRCAEVPTYRYIAPRVLMLAGTASATRD